MAIDTSASQVATNALQSLPFGTIIGAPLKACVEAQAQAANTTWEFIRNIGLNTDEKGNTKAVMVQFEYINAGRRMKMNIPLLTIVPIPYMAINEIEIDFKANISAASSKSSESSKSNKTSFELNQEFQVNIGIFKSNTELGVGVSSKKDSKATQESHYSVEYTMDVHVKASQDSMPAGMAKVLELLNGTVDTVNSKGELVVSDTTLFKEKGGVAAIIATYKGVDGLYDPTQIVIANERGEKKLNTPSSKYISITDNGESAICRFEEAGTYYIMAGECKMMVNIRERE